MLLGLQFNQISGTVSVEIKNKILKVAAHCYIYYHFVIQDNKGDSTVRSKYQLTSLIQYRYLSFGF